MGAKPKLGQMTMVVGPPKAWKSGLAQWMAVRYAQRGLGVIYLSADTSPEEVKTRVCAMMTGHRTEDIEEALLDGNAEEYYNEALEGLEKLRWDFRTAPDYDHVTELVLAYIELWGEAPSVLVLDNMLNFESYMEDPYRGYKEVQKYFKDLARELNCAVFILHHVNELKDPRYPAPRKDIAGKISQLPELIWSVAADDGLFRLATVANRSGFQDPNADKAFEFYVDIERMSLAENKWNLQNGVLL